MIIIEIIITSFRKNIIRLNNIQYEQRYTDGLILSNVFKSLYSIKRNLCCTKISFLIVFCRQEESELERRRVPETEDTQNNNL